jgi:hypothetical protein
VQEWTELCWDFAAPQHRNPLEILCSSNDATHRKEDLQQLLVGDLIWVKGDGNHLSMACLLATHLQQGREPVHAMTAQL